MPSEEAPKDVLWMESRVAALTREWEAGLADGSPHDARERMRTSLVCPIRTDVRSRRRTTMFERYRAEAKGDESFAAFARRVGANEAGTC